MHHVAIMKKTWGLIPKIISGEKTIESRWYQSRRAPWDRIKVGDTVYFKNSGERVSAVALVSHVLQFQIKDRDHAVRLVRKYGKQICIINKNPTTWAALPRYAVMIFLKKPKQIKPFDIVKKGFGNAAAWLTVPSVRRIKSL